MAETDPQQQAERMAELTFELLDHCQIKQQRLASDLSLTVAEFKLLRSFRTDESLTVGALAKRMELSNSRLTRILDGLQEKRIVRRETDQRDRRVLNIVLTDRGKSLQGQLNQSYIQTHLDILSLLPSEVVSSVILAMEKLRDAMKEWVRD